MVVSQLPNFIGFVDIAGNCEDSPDIRILAVDVNLHTFASREPSGLSCRPHH
jgi:hypothetical protein